MVFFLEIFDTSNNGCSPLDYQIFKTISLVQVCVHKLLHSLTRQFIIFALLVKLSLLLINIVY
jgi:hypothetical protein